MLRLWGKTNKNKKRKMTTVVKKKKKKKMVVVMVMVVVMGMTQRGAGRRSKQSSREHVTKPANQHQTVRVEILITKLYSASSACNGKLTH